MLKKYFWIMVAGCIVVFHLSGKSATAEFFASDIDSDCEIVMFSATWCGACKVAKAYFERKDYEYCEFDIDKPSPELDYYRRLGTRVIPTTLIGNKIVVGAKFDKIESLIEEFQVGN